MRSRSFGDGVPGGSLLPADLPTSPEARGKFLYAGGRKLWIKGVAYGTFRPDEAGDQFPGPDRVRADFSAMAAAGINTVRTYTIPPERLLDAAEEHGLRLLVAVSWEQHVAF